MEKLVGGFTASESLPWFHMPCLEYCAAATTTWCSLQTRLFCSLWTFVQYFSFEKGEDNCEVVAVCKFKDKQTKKLRAEEIKMNTGMNGLFLQSGVNTSKMIAWEVCQRLPPTE